VHHPTWCDELEPPHTPPGCDPWRGRRDWFQYEARRANNINDRYLWLVTSCKTPMCMAHIHTLKPLTIDYLPGVCVYCGLTADTKDHLVPRGWSGEVDRSWVLTVPACRECNSAIGAKWAPTVTERRDLAHKHIRKRYAKYLSRFPHTKKDMAEMGPNLRSYCEAGLQMRELVHDRLNWPPYEGYDIQAAQRSGIDDPYVFGLIR
jgi:hypothetical protein